MRRLAVLALTAAGVGLFASPALADELDEMFDRAQQAEYSGTKLVQCETPTGTVSQITEVKRADGITVVKTLTSDTEVIARPGEFSDRAGSYSRAATVATASPSELSDRYTLRVMGVHREIGRRVTAVEILQGDILRLSLRFDAATGAVLRSEVFNADGSAYCTSEFFVFDPNRPQLDLTTIEPDVSIELVSYTGDMAVINLPASAAGFTRIDVYEGSSQTAVAFYSDGLFSFTVVSSDKPLAIPELADVSTVDINGSEYLRRFFPAQVVISWESARGGLALVGHLPLDMQQAVLADLPKPGRPFFLARWWRALTGG